MHIDKEGNETWPQVARPLTSFPQLQDLRICHQGLRLYDGSGRDIARMLAYAEVASSRISSLAVEGFSSTLWQAMEALPTCMRASVTALELSDCVLDGPLFAPLRALRALRRVTLDKADFASGDAMASFGYLTQASSVCLKPQPCWLWMSVLHAGCIFHTCLCIRPVASRNFSASTRFLKHE